MIEHLVAFVMLLATVLLAVGTALTVVVAPVLLWLAVDGRAGR